MSRTVRIRRADGTLRLIEYSRSGRVKSDQPACESCQGTGVQSDPPDEDAWCKYPPAEDDD